jgi:acetyltransferase-like isoleucine patch superfamily enzyme
MTESLGEIKLGADRFFTLTDVSFLDLFKGSFYVWEALLRRDEFIRQKLKPNINAILKENVSIEGEVYIGKGTVVEPGAYIKGPTIIGKGCQIGHGASIRENGITGDNCVIGHAAEVIRSVLLNHVRVDHFAFVGDTILGNNCHLGASVILANIKMRFNPSTVKIRISGDNYDTGMRKLGSILGDDTQIGNNSMANPGTILERAVTAPPGTTLHGYYPSGAVLAASVPRGRPISAPRMGHKKTDWLDPIACPTCGRQITRVERVREMISYCKEFRGQCRCGQRYIFRRPLPHSLVLSFPDRQVEIVC